MSASRWFLTPRITLALDADAWAHIDAIAPSLADSIWFDFGGASRHGRVVLDRFSHYGDAPSPLRPIATVDYGDWQ